MGRKRHAEIVGGGIAGLSASVALAARGWSVRVHERADRLRARGSGIYLSENGLLVLEALGAYKKAVRGAFGLRFRETRDAQGALISRYDWTIEQRNLRQFMLLRQRLVESLGSAARLAGAEIVTGSNVIDARPAGEVELDGGRVVRADLVLVADGLNSGIRERLDLLAGRKMHKDGSIRMLLPLRHEMPWPEGVFAEYWSGRRRCFVVPCSEDHFYLGFVVREDDEAGRRIPIDKAVWVRSFPVLEPFISRVDEQERWSWDQYSTVRLRRWHVGRLALLGDAAHGMSPNFGQGGGIAMCSTLSLAACLDDREDLAAALDAWEQRERPMIESIQRLSALYSTFMAWPDWPRSIALWAIGRSRWIMKQRTRASYYRPFGLAPAHRGNEL